jgi:hypothetical protein
MGPEGVEVFPAGDPGHYFYIPRGQPEMASAGSPAVLLVKNSAGGMLQLGSTFTVDPADLAKILTRLNLAQDVTIPIKLDEAPLKIRGARLTLQMAGAPLELAKAQPSNLPPYTALFRATLNPEQTKAVEAALGGKTGSLTVAYDFDRIEKAGAHALISGEATRAATDLSEDASPEEAESWVQQAIENGTLKLQAEKWGAESESILARAIDAAKGKAVAFVLSMQGPSVTSSSRRLDTLSADVRLEEPRTRSDNRDADVGSWFAHGPKASILTAPDTGQASPGGAPVTVRLRFDPKDAPLAFIEVSGDGPAAALRGPVWQPVTVNSSGRIHLRVRYTTGAAPFENDIETQTSEHQLLIEELGMAQVVVDANARKTAGASQLKLDVKYVQNGQEADSWPIKFRYGDWTDQWFVVTGGPGLNGSLEYQWQETEADGSTTSGGPLTTHEPNIVI